MDSHILRIDNLSINQGAKRVLSNVGFTVNKGEFVYLIGRTGSGKSSLLKTVYGDLQPELGSVEVAGMMANRLEHKKIPFLRRKVGIVFQDFQLFMDRTVMENLLFVLKATGWKDTGKMKRRMNEVLMRVGMNGHLKKMPHQLSGGEQQRVVIARALLNEPVLMVADEPTGNLDPEVSRGIIKLFQDINLSGTSIMMATHDYTIIQDFPGRVLKCENGQVMDSNQEAFDYGGTGA